MNCNANKCIECTPPKASVPTASPSARNDPLDAAANAAAFSLDELGRRL